MSDFRDVIQAIYGVYDNASGNNIQGRPGSAHRIFRIAHTDGFGLAQRAAIADASRIEAPFIAPALIDYDLANNVYSTKFGAIKNAIRRSPRRRTEGTGDA